MITRVLLALVTILIVGFSTPSFAQGCAAEGTYSGLWNQESYADLTLSSCKDGKLSYKYSFRGQLYHGETRENRIEVGVGLFVLGADKNIYGWYPYINKSDGKLSYWTIVMTKSGRWNPASAPKPNLFGSWKGRWDDNPAWDTNLIVEARDADNLAMSQTIGKQRTRTAVEKQRGLTLDFPYPNNLQFKNPFVLGADGNLHGALFFLRSDTGGISWNRIIMKKVE